MNTDSKKIDAAFKVTPWQDGRHLECLKESVARSPFEFMFDQPDKRQVFVSGGRLRTMEMIIRKVGHDYNSGKKTNLPDDWFDRFRRHVGKTASINWEEFLSEVYHAGEPGSHVYFFKVILNSLFRDNDYIYCLLVTNKKVDYMEDSMMEYLDTESRFHEIGFSTGMMNNNGGCFEKKEI